MASTVNLLGVLKPNIGTPKFASNFINGDRPSGGGSSGDWQLPAGNFQSYSSPIIAYPRPDTETSSTARHRVNYTGQNYRVPVAVYGGAYPFYFELLAGPSGMTIGNQLIVSGGELIPDDDYGVINYPNSVAGTHTVTVRVTDQNLVENTVSWQLVVGTGSQHIFFNPSAGTNGTGTLASPYNNLSSLNGLTDKVVWFRAGTVDLEQKTSGLETMPKTWLPYNGENVVMNQALSSVGSNLGSDYWFSGFTFNLPSGRNVVRPYPQLFRLGGSSRSVFFENTFDSGGLSEPNGAGSNASVLMWENQNVGISHANNAWYCVVMKNQFKNIRDKDLFLGYSMRYAVVERNSIESCTTTGGGHGFYAKTNVNGFTFRGNYSIGTANTQKLLRVDAYTGNFLMDNYEISYNNYRFYGSDSSGDGVGAISFAHQFENNGTNHFVFRNSLYAQSAACIHARGTTSSSVITCTNNVMVSGGTNTNGVWLVQFDGTLTNTGYVAGNTSSGILDSNNKLNGAYTTNLGSKGSQVSGVSTVGTMNIAGTGFGTKTTGTPYFDNFQSRTVGAANSGSLGTATQMAISNPNYVSIVATGGHGNLPKAVQMDYAAASVNAQSRNSPSDPVMFPKIYHEFGTRTQKGYAAFWIKYSGANASNHNVWKMGRFTSGSVNPYADANLMTFTYYSPSGSSRPVSFSGESGGSITPNQYWGTTPATINPSTETPLYNPATVFAKDTWHFYEMEFDVGTLNTANAIAEERWDGTLTVRHGNGSNSMTFKTTTNPDDVYSIMTPICGLDNYSNIVMLMSEAYFDGSRCRVIMTDSATYSSSTKRAIQPVVNWSDTSINVKKNRGMFNVGETAYLHVWNSNGVLVHSSTAITVTEDNV